MELRLEGTILAVRGGEWRLLHTGWEEDSVHQSVWPPVCLSVEEVPRAGVLQGVEEVTDGPFSPVWPLVFAVCLLEGPRTFVRFVNVPLLFSAFGLWWALVDSGGLWWALVGSGGLCLTPDHWPAASFNCSGSCVQLFLQATLERRPCRPSQR